MKIIGRILDWLWPRSPNDLFYVGPGPCDECGEFGAIYLWHGTEACEDCMRFHLAKSRGAVCEPTDPGFAELQKTASKARRKSPKQEQEREAYAAMLRAVTAEDLAKMPAMISIPDVRPRKSPSTPTNKEKL